LCGLQGRRLAGERAVLALELLLELQQPEPEVAPFAPEGFELPFDLRRGLAAREQTADAVVRGLSLPEQCGLALPLLRAQRPGGAPGDLIEQGPAQPAFPAAPRVGGAAGPGQQGGQDRGWIDDIYRCAFEPSRAATAGLGGRAGGELQGLDRLGRSIE